MDNHKEQQQQHQQQQQQQQQQHLEFKFPFARLFASKELTSRTCGIPHVDSMELLNKRQSQAPENKLVGNTKQRASAPVRSC
jgi:hypothetical protein